MASRLPDWLTEAARTVERASDDKVRQNRMNHLHEVDTTVTKMLGKLAPLAAAAEVGASRWWPGASPPAETFGKVATARKSLDTRPWNAAEAALDKTITALEADLRLAWRTYVDRVIKGGKSGLRDLVKVLGSAPGLTEVAAEVDSALGALNKVRLALPDEQAMATVTAAAEALDRLADLLPADVQEFVDAATQEGAELSALTPEVMSWLLTNGVVGEFRVVVGGQATTKGRGHTRG
ncbi:hypothetical protein [Actinokineospora inagensis]|uniref:hypothetical protein n=1 Tax=Actinokineospora inagensis TaxID=103730 RepID=UPI00040F4049|nr:hypothetical protein [Actinokineospora inagensis]